MSSRSIFFKLVEQPKINKMNWEMWSDEGWAIGSWLFMIDFINHCYCFLLFLLIICKSVFLNWKLAYDEQWVRRALLRNSRVWTKKVLQRFCDEGKKLCSVTDSDNCLCVNCSINSFKCILKHVISLETK